MMGYFLNGVSGNEWTLNITMIPDTALLYAIRAGGIGYYDPTGNTTSYDWDGTTDGKDSITLDIFGEEATWYKIGTIPSWFEGAPDGGVCRFTSGERELVKSSGTGISFYYFDGSDKNESYFLVVDGGDFSFWWNGADHTGSAPSAGIYASPKCINAETGENIVSLTTFFGREIHKINPKFLPEISSGGVDFSEINSKIGDLSNLTTEDKTNLVAAVNEVKQTADDKQDKLIAGENITIAADGKTISAMGGTEITKTSQLENDSGFITLNDLPVYNGEIKNG